MITKTLVFSDVHIPFHNTKYLSLILEIIQDQKPDRVVINGDLGDLYNVSSYKKSPDVVTKYDDEIDAIRSFLRNIRRSSKNTELVYLLGNHEARVNLFIQENFGPMMNRLSIERELDLDNLVDKWQEYKKPYRIENTNLYIVHSPPSYSVNAARTSLINKPGGSWIYGCTHRPDFAYVRVDGEVPRYDRVYINGFLGDKKATKEHYKVFEYEKLNRSAPSMMMVTVVNGVDFHVELSLIENNIITINGVTYEARE